MNKGQASTAIAIIVVVVLIIAAIVAWLLLPGSPIMTPGGQTPGVTGPTIGNIPTTQIPGGQGNTWCNSGELESLNTGGIKSYAYTESNMEMFQGMYLCKGEINAVGGLEKYVYTNEDKTIWFVTDANGALIDTYIGGGNAGTGTPTTPTTPPGGGGGTTPPSIPTIPTVPTTGTNIITEVNLMSGKGVVCDFHTLEDGFTWDFTYKVKYPRMNIQHITAGNGSTSSWEDRGDITAVINDSSTGDMKLTDMYIILKRWESWDIDPEINVWYYDRYWHDFGDYDVAAPNSIVWLYNLTQQINSPDLTLDCRWEEFSDSELYLPSGVTPQEIPYPT